MKTYSQAIRNISNGLFYSTHSDWPIQKRGLKNKEKR